jgi:uncharacterized protein YndB with AHSA1/START domain
MIMAEFSTAIDIAATPQQVFGYLTTERGMVTWMGQHARLDPRPGGAFEVDIAGSPVRGHYLELDPPHRVVVSWGVAGNDQLPPGGSQVIFELTAIDEGTRVAVRHTGLPEAHRAGHADGWAHFTGRLAIAAAGDDPGPDDWAPLSLR